MYPDILKDDMAYAECRRLLMVLSAQRRILSQWLGETTAPADIPLNEDSAFVSGMLAMFRYARGEQVPTVIVQDFRDELLKVMFSGLASGAFALPPFQRMADKPWAVAWRLAEIRLAFEGYESTDVSQLAHLLGISRGALTQQLIAHGYDPNTAIPAEFLHELYEEFLKSKNSRHQDMPKTPIELDQY